MADKIAKLILKFEDAASKGVEAASKGIRGSFDRIVITAGDVVNALKFIGNQALQLVKDASTFETVERAFGRMAAAQGQDADAMLAKMRELSAGTVSDLKLMQQANTALALGLPVDRFGDMLEIARSASKATGESMEFMLQSIVTGLGRGSKLMLDNLGIVFDINKAYEEYAAKLGKTAEQLTDVEKKQAFINKALEVGKTNAEAAGSGTDDLNDKMARLNVSLENNAITLGKLLIPSFEALTQSGVGVSTFFQDLLNSEAVKDIFLGLAVVINDAVLALQSFGQAAGTILGGVWAASVEAMQGNFKAAIDLLKMADQEAGQIVQDANTKSIEDRQKFWEKLHETDRAAHDSELEEIRNRAKEKSETEKEASAEADQEKFDQLTAKHEALLAMEGATQEQLNQIAIKALEDEFKNAETHKQRMDALAALDVMHQKAVEDKRTLQAKEAQKQREKDQASTFATIANLSNSNNKTLATIGKAAALTQIAIAAPQGVSKALAAFPPPFNFAAAAAVGAAFAAQAAQVAGIQLAEGGIVPATPGGIQATIGEGGRSEAVIPLPDNFDPDRGLGGGAVNITFTGPILGDERQAREFAKKIDEALLNLRRSNESVSFDGVI
jgi:hypothetical protein